MSIDIDELQDPHHKNDFRRANGAPQVIDHDGKNQRLSRPSNYAKPLDDESALTNWRIDTACIGVASHRDLQARYVALDPEDRASKKDLREAAIAAGRGSEGADVGTAIHAMTDRWEQDENFSPPEPYLTQLRAYTAEMERVGLKSLFFEQPIVNLEWRAAGTTDRIYELTRSLITPHGEILEAGTLVIGDTKTTRKIDYSYPSYAAQMALYAGGEFYDVVNDLFVDTPTINQEWAIIMHIPSDGTTCEAQWVDLEVGRWGVYLASEVKKWRKMWRSGEYSCPPVQVIPDNLAEIAAEVVSVEQADDEHGAWITMMTEHAQVRIEAIRNYPEAVKTLTTFWPNGVPTPKQGIDSVSHMTAVLDHLDRVERDHELPFVPKPGIEGGHQSGINRTNTPTSKEDN